MTEETRKRLCTLADRYERSSFLESDPSQFLRHYTENCDIEIAAFTAAMLSFGNRKQFIPKIEKIITLADASGGICAWIKTGSYDDFFNSQDDRKFYRFYSYSEMNDFFAAIKAVLGRFDSLGSYVKDFCAASAGTNNSVQNAVLALSKVFEKCAIVPKGKNSANKRVHMFLRWMVRRNSPVDLGLWDWISPSDLIIPLDTHVIQESVKLALVSENAPASLKTAIKITDELKKIWPEDPCKGDFALFGLGVDS